jgi:hypothetical protein
VASRSRSCNQQRGQRHEKSNHEPAHELTPSRISKQFGSAAGCKRLSWGTNSKSPTKFALFLRQLGRENQIPSLTFNCAGLEPC